ncbi:hypothetical protein YIM1640_03570 [Thermus oshimai]|jgi:hypothetical protein|uniref:hypothetical protein n=1 Tax=Thermus oshimai TaxID=56957 RepID=UPI0031FB31F5
MAHPGVRRPYPLRPRFLVLGVGGLRLPCPLSLLEWGLLLLLFALKTRALLKGTRFRVPWGAVFALRALSPTLLFQVRVEGKEVRLELL